MSVLVGLWHIYRFQAISSTMDTARDLVPQSQFEPYVVLASEQTQGRGRHQRAWSSPVGNFYATLALPITDLSSAPFFSYIAALAVFEALRSLMPDVLGQKPSPITLKWPNDILIDSKKIGGLLLEVEETPQGSMLLIGVGVNLVSHPETTPYPATHCAPYARITPEDLLPPVLEAFDHWHRLFKEEGFKPLRHAWLESRDAAHSSMVLKGYEHRSPHNISGTFHDLDEHGRLVLECTNEQGERDLKKFSAGDVFFS